MKNLFYQVCILVITFSCVYTALNSLPVSSSVPNQKGSYETSSKEEPYETATKQEIQLSMKQFCGRNSGFVRNYQDQYEGLVKIFNEKASTSEQHKTQRMELVDYYVDYLGFPINDVLKICGSYWLRY